MLVLVEKENNLNSPIAFVVEGVFVLGFVTSLLQNQDLPQCPPK